MIRCKTSSKVEPAMTRFRRPFPWLPITTRSKTRARPAISWIGWPACVHDRRRPHGFAAARRGRPARKETSCQSDTHERPCVTAHTARLDRLRSRLTLKATRLDPRRFVQSPGDLLQEDVGSRRRKALAPREKPVGPCRHQISVSR